MGSNSTDAVRRTVDRADEHLAYRCLLLLLLLKETLRSAFISEQI